MTKTITQCPTDSGILLVSGPEACKFLQGQTTCDINQISTTQSLLGAHCNPKGRMIADFRALALSDEQVALRTRSDALPLLQASLGKYAVFSKAELEVDTRLVSALLGEEVIPVLEQWLDIELSEDNQTFQGSQGIFVRIRHNLIECWLTPEQQTALETYFGNQLTQGDLDQWLLANIRDGIGQVTAATSGEWIPQMLNMQVPQLSGISFTKGCYTGQEIVARMQYLGKLKRHMYRVAGPIMLTPGTPVFTSGSEQSVGEVVLAVETHPGVEFLVVATETAIEKDQLFADAQGETKLEILTQPYPLTIPE